MTKENILEKYVASTIAELLLYFLLESSLPVPVQRLYFLLEMSTIFISLNDFLLESPTTQLDSFLKLFFIGKGKSVNVVSGRNIFYWKGISYLYSHIFLLEMDAHETCNNRIFFIGKMEHIRKDNWRIIFYWKLTILTYSIVLLPHFSIGKEEKEAEIIAQEFFIGKGNSSTYE